MKRFIMIIGVFILAVSCGQNSASTAKDVKIKDSQVEKLEINVEALDGTLDAEKTSHLYFLTFQQALPLLFSAYKPAEIKKLLDLKHMKDFKEGKTVMKLSAVLYETENFKTIKIKDFETTLFDSRPLDSSSKEKAEDFKYNIKVSAVLVLDPAELNEGAPKLDEDDDIGFLDDNLAALEEEEEAEDISENQVEQKPTGVAIALKTAFEANTKDKSIEVYGKSIAPSGLGVDNELNFLTPEESTNFIKENKFKKVRRKMGDIRGPTLYSKIEQVKDVAFKALVEIQEKR